MASTAPPKDQTLVRCPDHHPNGRAVPYAAAVAPAGDGEAVLCGSKGCEKPGLIWTTREAWNLYEKGERVFYPRTFAISIKAGERVHVAPSSA